MIGIIFTIIYIFILIRFRHKIIYFIKTLFAVGLGSNTPATARKKVKRLKEINRTQKEDTGTFQKIIDMLLQPVPLVAVNSTPEHATASAILMKGYQEAIAIRKQTNAVCNRIETPDIHQHIHYHEGDKVYKEKDGTKHSIEDIERRFLDGGKKYGELLEMD